MSEKKIISIFLGIYSQRLTPSAKSVLLLSFQSFTMSAWNNNNIRHEWQRGKTNWVIGKYLFPNDFISVHNDTLQFLFLLLIYHWSYLLKTIELKIFKFDRSFVRWFFHNILFIHVCSCNKQRNVERHFTIIFTLSFIKAFW